MNIRLAIMVPFLLGLGACMMPMPAQQGGSGSQSGMNGPEPTDAPPSAPDGPANTSASNPASGSSAPAGPSTVSVDIRSDCPKTVKVFYGEKPKFGSGTYSSVESNSVSSHQFNSGDMLWIVDDDQNGVASVTAKPGMSEIKVASDCTHLSAH
jgi:hypothetical protein